MKEREYQMELKMMLKWKIYEEYVSSISKCEIDYSIYIKKFYNFKKY